MSSESPDTRTDASEALFADLVRLAAANERGLPRPAPPQDPACARVLVGAYKERAAQNDAEGRHRTAQYLRERADEIHRSL
ncbi:hypothetical protein ACFU51_28415 [Streptomyces sp. NPDC057430]|uniref:hypothetical protein n=1 Tax=Streptomyces sp. NPDC057430 TaxID=3346131 RepID=UPI00367A497E